MGRWMWQIRRRFALAVWQWQQQAKAERDAKAARSASRDPLRAAMQQRVAAIWEELRGYQPIGHVDLTQVTPPQRPSPIAPQQPERERRLHALRDGEIAYTVPWTVYRTRFGQVVLDTDRPAYPTAEGTAQVRVRKQQGHYRLALPPDFEAEALLLPPSCWRALEAAEVEAWDNPYKLSFKDLEPSLPPARVLPWTMPDLSALGTYAEWLLTSGPLPDPAKAACRRFANTLLDVPAAERAHYLARLEDEVWQRSAADWGPYTARTDWHRVLTRLACVADMQRVVRRDQPVSRRCVTQRCVCEPSRVAWVLLTGEDVPCFACLRCGRLTPDSPAPKRLAEGLSPAEPDALLMKASLLLVQPPAVSVPISNPPFNPAINTIIGAAPRDLLAGQFAAVHRRLDRLGEVTHQSVNVSLEEKPPPGWLPAALWLGLALMVNLSVLVLGLVLH